MNFLSSYKNRFILICAGVPFLLIITWKLAVSETYFLFKEYSRFKHNIEQYENPDSVISILKCRLADFQDASIPDPDELDENLMDIISKNISSYNIRLEEFPQTHLFKSNNYQVQTYKLSFSGKFTDLLRFIYFAESEISSCRIISTSFNRKELRKTGEKLYLDIYFQSIYPT